MAGDGCSQDGSHPAVGEMSAREGEALNSHFEWYW
jgi:hypothetical protein